MRFANLLPRAQGLLALLVLAIVCASAAWLAHWRNRATGHARMLACGLATGSIVVLATERAVAASGWWRRAPSPSPQLHELFTEHDLGRRLNLLYKTRQKIRIHATEVKDPRRFVYYYLAYISGILRSLTKNYVVMRKGSVRCLGNETGIDCSTGRCRTFCVCDPSALNSAAQPFTNKDRQDAAEKLEKAMASALQRSKKTSDPWQSFRAEQNQIFEAHKADTEAKTAKPILLSISNRDNVVFETLVASHKHVRSEDRLWRGRTQKLCRLSVTPLLDQPNQPPSATSDISAYASFSMGTSASSASDRMTMTAMADTTTGIETAAEPPSLSGSAVAEDGLSGFDAILDALDPEAMEAQRQRAEDEYRAAELEAQRTQAEKEAELKRMKDTGESKGKDDTKDAYKSGLASLRKGVRSGVETGMDADTDAMAGQIKDLAGTDSDTVASQTFPKLREFSLESMKYCRVALCGTLTEYSESRKMALLAKNLQYPEMRDTGQLLALGTSTQNAKTFPVRIPWNYAREGAVLTSTPNIMRKYEIQLVKHRKLQTFRIRNVEEYMNTPSLLVGVIVSIDGKVVHSLREAHDALNRLEAEDRAFVVVNDVSALDHETSHLAYVTVRLKRDFRRCQGGWDDVLRVYVGHEMEAAHVDQTRLWLEVSSRLQKARAQRSQNVVLIDSDAPVDTDGVEYTQYNFGLTTLLGSGRANSLTHDIMDRLKDVQQLIINFSDFEDACLQDTERRLARAVAGDKQNFQRDLRFLERLFQTLEILGEYFDVVAITSNHDEVGGNDQFNMRRKQYTSVVNTGDTVFAPLFMHVSFSLFSRLRVTYVRRDLLKPEDRTPVLDQFNKVRQTAFQNLPGPALATLTRITPFSPRKSKEFWDLVQHQETLFKYVQGSLTHGELERRVMDAVSAM